MTSILDTQLYGKHVLDKSQWIIMMMNYYVGQLND